MGEENEQLEQIKSILDVFRKSILKVGLLIDQSQAESSCTKCLQHHREHIRRHQIEETSVDPLKIFAWFGYDLAENLTLQSQQLEHASDIAGSQAKITQRRDVIKALVMSMNTVIAVEKPEGGLDGPTLRYLVRFLEHELDGTCDHGIGQNGIFAAFHSALSMKRVLKKKFTTATENSTDQ